MNKRICIAVSLIAVAITVLLGSIFLIDLPAKATYNRLFASKATMAYDQATFEGMRTQVILLWEQMNKTFSGFDFANTYNTPWYWDQTYDNSLKAQEDYFKQLVYRLDQTITEKDTILAGNKTILYPYNQWYQQTLDSLRAEMKREGGIVWAIGGAWYLNFAPMKYWLSWWLIPLLVALFVAAFIILLSM